MDKFLLPADEIEVGQRLREGNMEFPQRHPEDRINLEQICIEMNKENQLTDKLLMIRPAAFGHNTETAATNAFQKEGPDPDPDLIRSLAVKEFDQLVRVLREAGLEVLVFEDSPDPVKPDAVFPNNWITTHADGSLITYPMLAPSRRTERREDIISSLSTRFQIHQRYSFETYEEEGQILEGTGSMVLDRVNHLVYACLGPRTDIELLEKFALLKQYRKIVFHATDPLGHPVYHTNVIMAMGRQCAAICLDCIDNEDEKDGIIDSLNASNKKIIDLSWEQILQFSGNMLQVVSKDGRAIWLMSEAACQSLTDSQKNLLQEDGRIISCPIPTIEKYGGGSIRCMLAEIFLPEKKK